MKLVSIVIPYNEGNELFNHSITSILEQSYENIELIIMHTEAQKEFIVECSDDQRVQFVEYTERTRAHAYNAALQVIKGEYCLFLEDDVILHDIMIEMMMAPTQKTNHDVIICNLHPSDLNGIHKMDQFDVISKLGDQEEIGFFLCNKIFKTHLIQNNKIQFNESYREFEDQLFVLDVLVHTQDIIYFDVCMVYVNPKKELKVRLFEDDYHSGIAAYQEFIMAICQYDRRLLNHYRTIYADMIIRTILAQYPNQDYIIPLQDCLAELHDDMLLDKKVLKSKKLALRSPALLYYKDKLQDRIAQL